MASVINTNVSSLNAQRNLSSSQSSLATSLQRLSTGLRINSAKDDAAGLAISERFTSQIRGLNQAARNANDGISLAQTAEGALGNSGDILQRIRELAVQSANATNNGSDRKALQAEVSQLVSELSRVADQTSFNGRNLLDGTFGTSQFQVGANAGETIQAQMANFTTKSYGDYRGTSLASDANITASNYTAGNLTIAGVDGSKTVAVTTASTAKSIAADITAVADDTGVTATAKTEIVLTLGAETYSLEVKGDNTTAKAITFTLAGTTSEDLAQAVTAFNDASGETGVTAEIDSSGKVKLTHATGANIEIKNTAAAANTILTVGDTDTKAAAAVAIVNGQVTTDSASSYSVTEAAAATSVFSATNDAVTTATLKSVASLDISTVDGSNLALKIVDNALNRINSQRANLGALQSRFESAVSNIQVTSENLSASRSRIRDADFAQETANLTRAQILQQAGTAMLSQANSLPQNVLSLLG
ncbi:MAG: flagellin [Methylophaga sp.]|nr:MAG: flagellin [Methylophaga sp.]